MNIATEAALLLSCGRKNLSDGDRSRIRGLLVIPGFGWDRMLQAAKTQGLMPLVSRHLLSEFADRVPEWVRERLRTASLETAKQSLLQTRELQRVVRILTAAGVRCLAYKGVALALSLYGDIGSRQSCDVDILVHRKDVFAARKALVGADYVPFLNLLPAQLSSYVDAGSEMQFSGPESDVLVELQWQIVPRYFSVPLDLERFFERADRRTISGVEIETLSLEDTALVLAVHGGKHRWSRLSLACDFAELLRNGNIDWDAVKREGERSGLRDMLVVAIGVASRLFNAPVPGNFLSAAGPRQRKLMARFCGDALKVPENTPAASGPSLSDFALQLSLREKWVDRARMLYRLAVTPSLSEWSAADLPGRLSILYLFIRFCRLSRRLLPAGLAVRARR